MPTIIGPRDGGGGGGGSGSGFGHFGSSSSSGGGSGGNTGAGSSNRIKTLVQLLAVVVVLQVAWWLPQAVSSRNQRSELLALRGESEDRLGAMAAALRRAAVTRGPSAVAKLLEDAEQAGQEVLTSALDKVPAGAATGPVDVDVGAETAGDGELEPPPPPPLPVPRATVPPKAAATPRGTGINKCKGMSAPIHFLSYATFAGRDELFCLFLQSAAQHNIDVQILNWGGQHIGNGQKLVYVKEAVSKMDDCDIVLFTDAYDVLYTNFPDEVVEKFMELDEPLLFGAECGCWPQISFKNGHQICMGIGANSYPRSPTPYVFLNTGVWAGRAHAARDFLDSLLVKYGGNGDLGAMDDQHAAADFFLSGTSNIKLDYYAKFFQNMHRADDFGECNPSQHLEARDNRLFNRVTQTHPSLLHFNGGSKHLMREYEAKLWYKSPGLGPDRQPLRGREMLDHVFKISDQNHRPSSLTFAELCPQASQIVL